MIAKLIGESSGGMTAVEIWDGDVLVWSNRWFDNGATHAEYVSGLAEAYRCMRDCGSVMDWYEVETRGEEPEEMDTESTTGVMLEYDSDTDACTIGEDLGQSIEIVNVNQHLAGEIEYDDLSETEKDVLKKVEDEVSK